MTSRSVNDCGVPNMVLSFRRTEGSSQLADAMVAQVPPTSPEDCRDPDQLNEVSDCQHMPRHFGQGCVVTNVGLPIFVTPQQPDAQSA